MSKYLSLFGLMALAGIGSAPVRASEQPAAPVVEIRIDGAEKRQRVDGFGASAFGGFALFERGHFDGTVPKGVTYRTTPQQREEMLTAAVRELGVSHARLWLPYLGIENVNDNDDPNVINWAGFTWEGFRNLPASDRRVENRMNGLQEWGAFLEAVVPRGLQNWIVTPSGMPDWLKSRFEQNAPDFFAEYAEWAAAQLLYLKRTFSKEAPYWSLFNEPDNLGKRAPDYWRQWIKTTGERFRREGLQTKLVIPDFMDANRAVPLTRDILQDGEARQYVGALAYHHYRSSGDDPRPFLAMTAQAETADAGADYDRVTRGARAMARLGRQYGLPSWQTETAYYPARAQKMTDWEIGRGRANEIYYELASGAAAVEGMLMLWVDAIDPRYNESTRREGHLIVMTTDGQRAARWEVTKNTGAVFAHYSRYVRPGDYRVEAACAEKMLRVTAFVSESRKVCVAVVINNAAQPKSVAFHLKNAPGKIGFFGGLLTDEERALAAHPIVRAPESEDAYRAELPPRSLCTFVWAQSDLGKLTLPAWIPVR